MSRAPSNGQDPSRAQKKQQPDGLPRQSQRGRRRGESSPEPPLPSPAQGEGQPRGQGEGPSCGKSLPPPRSIEDENGHEEFQKPTRDVGSRKHASHDEAPEAERGRQQSTEHAFRLTTPGGRGTTAGTGPRRGTGHSSLPRHEEAAKSTRLVVPCLTCTGRKESPVRSLAIVAIAACFCLCPSASVMARDLPPLFERFSLIHDLLHEREVKVLQLELRREGPDRASVQLLSPSRLWRLTPVFLLARGGMTSQKVDAGRSTRFEVPLEAPSPPARREAPLSLPGTATSVASSFDGLPLDIESIRLSVRSLRALEATTMVFHVDLASEATLMELATLSSFLGERNQLSIDALATNAGPPALMTLELSVPARALPVEPPEKTPIDLLALRERCLAMGIQHPRVSASAREEGGRRIELGGELAADAPWAELLGRILLLPGLSEVEGLGWKKEETTRRLEACLIFVP